MTYDLKAYAACARRAAAEGAVLLRNENHILPLAGTEKIALFGRSQFNYYKSGTGSGGMVNVTHVVDIPEALAAGGFQLNEKVKAAYENWLKDHPFDTGVGWAAEPWFQEEMPLSDALIEEAAAESDTAIIIIGRTAGEDKDSLVEEGSWLLTRVEEQMLEKVCGTFARTIVLLNVGNIIDMKWVEKYQPQAVLYVWQGGQEGGNAVLDVLTGAVPVSGKLPDTIARDIRDYASTANFGDPNENIYEEDIYVGYRYFETFAKDKVLYPFGYGLTYTTFDVETVGFAAKPVAANGKITVKVRVKNTGDYRGKEVVQVYVEKPQGRLGQPTRSLVAYGKTRELAPGEEETLTLSATWYGLSTYDDEGVTGHKSAYVLEAGSYTLFVGTDVRSAGKTAVLEIPETLIIQQLEEAMAPARPALRIQPVVTASGNYRMQKVMMPERTVKPLDRRAERLPEELVQTGNRGWKLADVRDGKISMDEFIAQLSDEDLFAIVRGEGMCSPKVTAGTAGAFGGVTDSLLIFGIPIACCADGPSGIRMDCGTIAFAMPNGTCLASSFNDAIAEELYQWEGLELRKNKIDTLLGPGMNIHRNPLNGRNFEYFSEDPVLTGRMAAAQLRGMGKYGVTGTIKHFAGNNQELRRHFANGIVSERALREIYLKGFEIAVKEGGACSIMSTYGPINDIYTASNYDLLTTILRGEWGFTGIVMTDWWGKAAEEGEPGTVQNTAQMVRAQNDLTMVVNDAASNSNMDNSAEGLQNGIVTRAEFQRTAANICRTIMHFPVMDRFLGIKTWLDEELEKSLDSLDQAMADVKEIVLTADAPTVLDPAEIDTATGKTTVFQVSTPERGIYTLKLKLRTEGQQPLAQVPVSIFYERDVVKMITLTGEDTEPQEFEVTLMPAFFGRFYLKFYFGLGGMVIDEAKIELAESQEERFAELAKHMGEN